MSVVSDVVERVTGKRSRDKSQEKAERRANDLRQQEQALSVQREAAAKKKAKAETAKRFSGSRRQTLKTGPLGLTTQEETRGGTLLGRELSL